MAQAELEAAMPTAPQRSGRRSRVRCSLQDAPVVSQRWSLGIGKSLRLFLRTGLHFLHGRPGDVCRHQEPHSVFPFMLGNQIASDRLLLIWGMRRTGTWWPSDHGVVLHSEFADGTWRLWDPHVCLACQLESVCFKRHAEPCVCKCANAGNVDGTDQHRQRFGQGRRVRRSQPTRH